MSILVKINGIIQLHPAHTSGKARQPLPNLSICRTRRKSGKKERINFWIGALGPRQYIDKWVNTGTNPHLPKTHLPTKATSKKYSSTSTSNSRGPHPIRTMFFYVHCTSTIPTDILVTQRIIILCLIHPCNLYPTLRHVNPFRPDTEMHFLPPSLSFPSHRLDQKSGVPPLPRMIEYSFFYGLVGRLLPYHIKPIIASPVHRDYYYFSFPSTGG